MLVLRKELLEGEGVTLGVILTSSGATFRTWAQDAVQIYLAISAPGVPISANWRPTAADLMTRDPTTSYWSKTVAGVAEGWRYRYWVVGQDGTPAANDVNLFKRDPRAAELEMGGWPDVDCIVRGPNRYPWHDAGFNAPAFNDLIIYQFHMGVFYAYLGGVDIRRNRVSKFLDAIDRIEYWAALGINAVEPLPIVEWQSEISQGYNNTDFFSPETDFCVDSALLGPYMGRVNALLAKKSQPPITAADISDQRGQLCAFVDLCHLHGIAVIGDVVYNHGGGPFDDQSMRFFSRQHNHQWWDADDYFISGNGWAGGRIFDYGKTEVRSFLIDNGRDYYDMYHFDGLRYDEVSAMYNNGGAQLCRDITATLRYHKGRAIQIAEYWNWDRAKPVQNQNGLGFDAAWDDRLEIQIRQVLSDVARGASQPIDLDPVRDALRPAQGFPSSWSSIRYLENHDLVNADRDDPSKIKPRIAKLASWSNPHDQYGRGRSRVSSGTLLTSPGIPMMFMGEELLEDKNWHPNPANDQYFIWWDGLDPANADGAPMRDFNRFIRELCALRRSLPALRGEGINPYHVNNYDRVLAFHRWVEGVGEDVIVVASFREAVYWDYSLPLPIRGHFREVFNGAAYDQMPSGGGYNTSAPGNAGGIDANGPPIDNCPVSAKCVLPPFSFLVFVRT